MGLVKRLRAETSGLALIEFAYTLPILVGFGLVGIEFTNVVLAHQKSERVASTLADTVAGNQVPPNERQIRDMFEAVQLISAPFSFDPEGNVILTAVVGAYDEDDEEIQNKIAWQRCVAKDKFKSDIGDEWTTSSDIAEGPGVDLPGEIELAQNEMVIIAEVFFPYTEIVSEEMVEGLLPNSGVFRETAMFRTRGAAIMNVTPVTGVEAKTC
ncbi:MAG: hypothetical protein AAF291_03625 [Pseudomonadota bacterium]